MNGSRRVACSSSLSLLFMIATACGGSGASRAHAVDAGADGLTDASDATVDVSADSSPTDALDAGDAGDGAPALHSYPRIGVLQWGGGNADWLGRFQLVMTIPGATAMMSTLKTAHPGAKVLWTTDWNAGGPFRKSYVGPDSLPRAWALHTSTGATIFYGSQPFADITNYCPTFTGHVNGFDIKGERYNQALPRYIDTMTDWSVWDGVNSDGTWDFPGSEPDIDLDRDGINDYNETSHGATAAERKAWIAKVWADGQDAARAQLRKDYARRFGNQDARLITYWTIGNRKLSIDTTNGVGWENMFWNWPRTFSAWPPLIQTWENQGPKPRVNFVSGDIFYDAVHAPPRRKDYFRFVRWALGIALQSDVYFMSGDLQNHHFASYYDEYDVPLGQPRGPGQALANGAWVRFFDHGAALVNPTNQTLTISDADLQTASGYAGPYYRFKGNQDPTWNDGSKFVSAVFPSTVARGISDNGTVDSSDHAQNVGEGILLVDTPDKTVISDIIVDNAYAGTSPGSKDTVLSGFAVDHQALYSTTNPAWTAAIRDDSDPRTAVSAVANCTNGAATATATYYPGVHVAGHYQVFEWHGWAGDTQSSQTESPTVPVTIYYGGGRFAELHVDQTKGYGAWNSLGTYAFAADGSASIVVTNAVGATGCQVVADAFKLVYVGP